MRILPHLNEAERKQLIRAARKTKDPIAIFRSQVIATLCAGRSRNETARCLACAVSAVCTTMRRFVSCGFAGLSDGRASNGAAKVHPPFLDELNMLLHSRPPDSGWQRPTWTRELLALEMHERGFPLVAPCTMGRALSTIGARRGTPKPVVVCPWPWRRQRRLLAALSRLVAGATDEAPVVHADEIDLHLNPKVGLDWMPRGHQRWLVTPGKNQKHYFAGARDAVTGRITWVDGEHKNSRLFCRLLDQLLVEYPDAKRIHVICDNYIIHSSKITQRHLAKLDGRVVLHFLPPYSPDHNPIERVWQDLHANVTRNHRCETMQELLANAHGFLHAHNDRAQLKPSLRRALPVAA
jgi:transposase